MSPVRLLAKTANDGIASRSVVAAVLITNAFKQQHSNTCNNNNITMTNVLDTVGHSLKQWWYDVRQNPLLLAWHFTVLLSVICPLLVYAICHSRYQGEGGGSQDNDDNNNNGWTWWWKNNNNNDNDDNNNSADDAQNGWWYNLWFGGGEGEEQRREEEQGASAALVFVYLWTLGLFCFIVYQGHHHIQSLQHNKTLFWNNNKTGEDRSFLMVLFLFVNLAFVACILVACNLRGMDERVWEEYGFFGMFASCMFVTYALWTFWGSVFCGILYKPSGQKEYDSSSNNNNTASDYQRQDDSDNQNHWSWFGGHKKQQEKVPSEQGGGGGGWMAGWIPPEKEETTPSGIKVKTQGDEEHSSMAPFECLGSDASMKQQSDAKQQGTMA